MNKISVFILSYFLFATNVGHAEQIKSAPPISDLIGNLEMRVKSNPNNMNDWVLLAKSYHYLKQWEKSKQAFAQAKALGYTAQPPNLDKATTKQTSRNPINTLSWANNRAANRATLDLIQKHIAQPKGDKF